MHTDIRRIGQYTLQERLGHRHEGEVWKAFDMHTQRFVAFKFLHLPPSTDPDFLKRLESSVQAIAFLRHSNIVRVRDFQFLPSLQSGSAFAYLVMEYVEGQSLTDYIHNTLHNGKFPLNADIVHLFASVGTALDYAHQQGMIHRNLKPTNILLKRNSASLGRIGEPVLTDFGLAPLFAASPGALARRSLDTACYTSPEQAQGQSGSARSDLYSLGVILYELCTGVLPFHGNRSVSLLVQHINASPPSPVLINPNISPALSQVILRSLAKHSAERYSSASTLALALTRALGVPVPEPLSQVASLSNNTNGSDNQAPLSPHGTASPALPPQVARPRESQPGTTPAPGNGRTGSSFPGPASQWKRKQTSVGSWYILALLVLLVASLGTFGALFLSSHTTPIAPGQVVGRAFFANSGQFNPGSPQGLNDELQLDLSQLPDPSPAKRYYAWLLSDSNQSEAAPILLGRLPVDHGQVHFLYQGTQQHTNLLAFISRFLITEDDAQAPTGNPLIDTGTWRYYAEIPQLPVPGDKLHFSMLDHLRHLLVESPELTVRGLHGGLAFWFARNTATISELASGARDDWHSQDTAAVRDQLIRILDYLDGASFVHTDVPPGTPLLADPRATQVALLGPVPQNPDAPGYTYSDEASPGYVYLISIHMEGAIESPQTTPEQRKLAIAINAGIDDVKRLFERMQQGGRQLLAMSNTQLLQTSSLSLLNDLATQAQGAYTGRLDPATGQSNGGALWIYGNLQRLATFEVRPYIAPAP